MSSTTSVGECISSRSTRGAPKTASVPIGSTKISWRRSGPAPRGSPIPKSPAAPRRTNRRGATALDQVRPSNWSNAAPAQLRQRGGLHPLVGEVDAHDHGVVALDVAETPQVDPVREAGHHAAE